jgi:hypothetical protein
MRTLPPIGPPSPGGPSCIHLCKHQYDDYRHDCDVCRHTRQIGPKLKGSPLLKLMSEAQGSLEVLPPRENTEREKRRQSNLARLARSLNGERTRVRRAG